MSNDNLLDDILQDDQVNLTEYERENYILDPLLTEIDLVEDQNIKYFVRSILMRADAFWDMSVGPEYGLNPLDEYEASGAVLHTKRVVRTVVLMCDSFGLVEIDRDIMIAAALLHDVTKGIRDTGDPGIIHYDPMYPYTVDAFVTSVIDDDQKHASETQSSTLYLDDAIAHDILRLIHCHKGPFSPIPETYPQTIMENILHVADRVASKLHYIIDGEEVIEERWSH